MNEELDRICCEFAGLTPSFWTPIGMMMERTEEPQWPPVSSEWSAAGALMNALEAKWIPARIKCTGGYGMWVAKVGPGKGVQANSGPMALALAVRRVAELGR